MVNLLLTLVYFAAICAIFVVAVIIHDFDKP